MLLPAEASGAEFGDAGAESSIEDFVLCTRSVRGVAVATSI